MPFGWAGDCQIRRTDVVRTSGNRIPTGGPGTVSRRLFFRRNRKVPPAFLTFKLKALFNCNTLALPRALTIIQSPFKDGWRGGPSIPNPCESQNLNLIEHIFPQTSQLDTVCGIPLHCPEVDRTVWVLFLICHLTRWGDRKEKLGKVNMEIK